MKSKGESLLLRTQCHELAIQDLLFTKSEMVKDQLQHLWSRLTQFLIIIGIGLLLPAFVQAQEIPRRPRPPTPLPDQQRGNLPGDQTPNPRDQGGNEALITLTLEPALIYQGDRVTLRWSVKDPRAGVEWASPVHIKSPFRTIPAIPDPAPKTGSYSFTAGPSPKHGIFTLSTGSALFYSEKTVDYHVEVVPFISRLMVENDFLVSNRGHRDERVAVVGRNFGEQRGESRVNLFINRQTLPMPVVSWTDERIVVRVHNITPLGTGSIRVSKAGGRLVSNSMTFIVAERRAAPSLPLLAFGKPWIVKPKSEETHYNPQGGRDLSDHYALATEVTYNAVRSAGSGAQQIKFTLFTYNIAQVPIGYAGERTKTQNIDDIARHLNNARYGVVCLQEAFDDNTRDRLKSAVHDNYPYQKRGHDGDGPLEGDGGLLILSRFPIVQTHRLKFSEGSGLWQGAVDYYAAKGVLHTRIQIGAGIEDTVDIFTTHTDSRSARIRRSQFGEAIEFIRRHSSSDWWILAGDMNTNGNRQTPDYAGLSDQYSVMMNVLQRLRDLWTGSYTLTGAPGYTSDDGNDFTGEAEGAGGSRIDYILVHGPPPPPPAVGVHSPGERRPRQR